MTILEVIQYVHEQGGHKNQYRYDFPREKIYSLAGIHTGGFQPKTVLDAGCAYGTMSVILAKAGMKVKALDCMPKLHSDKLFKKEKIEFEKLNLETDPITRKYDLVLLMDVLEHFNYNPLPVLQKLRKVANKGIILSTPAREVDPAMPETAKYADCVNWKMIPKLYNKYTYDFVDSHHHTYTRWELEELLKEAGFTITYCKLLPYEKTWFITARCA